MALEWRAWKLTMEEVISDSGEGNFGDMDESRPVDMSHQ